MDRDSDSISVNSEAPQQFYNDNQDAQSQISLGTVPTNNTNRLTKTRTETYESLHEKGIESEIPLPGINKPPVHDPIFPEEYTMETETGLVKVETLQSLGRRRLSRVTSLMLESGEAEEKLEEESEQFQGEKELDPEIELVTFTKDDPENPVNWPMSYKIIYTLILSLLVIQAAYGSSSLAGGLPLINEKFGVSTEVSTLSVSLMVMGFCVGPLVWAPLSEQIGRKPVYVISFGLYVIFNIPIAVAKNIGTVLVCRFLCGCFSSSALTIVGASICDIHDITRGFAIAVFSFCPYSGPVFGGIVNGFISVDSGRYDLMVWVNMAFAGVMWILVSFVPETYAPVILKNRAKKLRKETGNPKIMTEQEVSPLTLKELANENLIMPLKFIVQEPVLDLICAFIALIYALLYAFFFAYPEIFGKLYGYGLDKVGLMYIPILIGAGLALVFTVLLESRYNKLIRTRKPEPEDRLMGAMIGAPFPAIALFILGATSYKHLIWVAPASSGIAFGFGMVLLYYSLNNFLLDIYATKAASALGTKVFLRSSGGAAFPLFVSQMYHKLGLQWASWLLAFISLAMMFIPFAFYFYGKKLRSSLSKHDYSAKLQQKFD